MSILRNLLILLALSSQSAFAVYEKDAWITKKDYSNVCVIVAGSASPTEIFAASEFIKYWRMTTGHEAKLVVNTMGLPELNAALVPTPATAVNVWIGLKGIPPLLLDGINLQDYEEDGFLLRTRNRGETKRIKAEHLFIFGAPKRGSLYGVYQFFEDVMGVRWFTPDFTYAPKDPPESIPVQDFVYTPPLIYRDTNYRPFVQNPYFALVHRLNGNSLKIPEEWGGHIAYAKAGFGHTFHYFVPPESYGESHPEYFSEINGKRQTNPHATQLDLTNPDVLEITKQKVANLLETGEPNERIVSITQMDWPFWCESWPMKALDELEGSPSGSLIRFVNEVARWTKSQFPDAFIDTFAYTFTRKPPKFVRPLDNVIVRLCSIECDFVRPLSDSKSVPNRKFRKDLQGWAKITKNLFIWDYTQNWYCFQGPHPNFHVLQPNIKLMVDNGVTGIFEQASPSSPHSDFEYLKAYLLGKALWDPKMEWEAAFHDFVDHYYREAAPYVIEYIGLITKRAQMHDEPVTIFSKMDWMDYETVVTAEEIFKRAFYEVKDPEIKERLKYAYLPVQYSALVCRPKVEMTTDAYYLSRPPSQSFDEYWNMIMSYGITHLQDTPIEEFRERLDGKTPPREEVVPLHRIESPFFEVWVTPTKGGTVRRWRDKRDDREIFRDYTNPAGERYIWQEWEVMNPDKPKKEEPVSATYEVVAQSTGSLTLRATLLSGLVISRTMTLEETTPVLSLTLEMHNASGAPLIPLVKTHPEFWTQGEARPQFWVEDQDGWRDLDIITEREMRDKFGSLEPKGLKRWALRVSGKSFCLVNTFQAEELDSLIYYHNPDMQQANLELRPLQTPLAPGEKRFLHATYEITDNIPMDESLMKLMQRLR